MNTFVCCNQCANIFMNNTLRIVMIAIAALLTLSFAESPQKIKRVVADDGYRLVFSDEFNLPNGSQPDSTKWSRCKRYDSMWNRWISSSKDVVYIKNGKLVCRAIPNRNEPNDTAKMLTGAIWTKDKYSFKYGRLLVRMKTNVHQGNFPAVWLGRQQLIGHKAPYGEIDVVEMFGNKRQSNHNIHTQLTIDNPRHGLRNSFSHNVDVSKWHVYGIEWTPEYVQWTVDSEVVGVFFKSKDKTLLQKHQWTFDDSFFILVNQSVGNGAHGMVPDVNYVYETQFDWVRVYQK